jgi:hypothetical protein
MTGERAETLFSSPQSILAFCLIYCPVVLGALGPCPAPARSALPCVVAACPDRGAVLGVVPDGEFLTVQGVVMGDPVPVPWLLSLGGALVISWKFKIAMSNPARKQPNDA